MEYQNQSFLQVLKVPDCELWQIRDHLCTFQTHDNLFVLYSKELNLFLLKLDEFYWALEPKLQILASVQNKTEDYVSLLIPSIHSYFIIKIKNSTSEPIRKNLETILENIVEFKEVPSLAKTLKSYQVHEEKHQQRIFDKVINVISEKITPYLTVHHGDHQNQLEARSFEQLKDVGIHSVPVFDIPKTKVKELKTETKNITLHAQENEYWREVREGISRKKSHGEVISLGPDDPISGTGLTTQSMGTEIGVEEQHGEPEIVGEEKRKSVTEKSEKPHIPLAQAEETGISKEELESGNLEDPKLNQVPSLSYLEENAFTSGLLAKKGKVDENVNTPINKDDEGGFLERPFTYQLNDHGHYSLPKFPPAEYSQFRFSDALDRANATTEKTQEKSETKTERELEKRMRHDKETSTHHDKENVEQTGAS